MKLARTAFIIVAVPYTLVLLLWLFLAWMVPDRSDGREGLTFGLCGGGYIYGSLFSFREDMPLGYLIFLGVCLNLIGGIFWLPAFTYPGGSVIGLTGVALYAVWVRAIYCAYRLKHL